VHSILDPVVSAKAIAVAFCLIVGGHALGQTRPSITERQHSISDLRAYEAFFGQVQRLVQVQMPIQDALPVTDREDVIIRTISTEIRSQLARLRFAKSQVSLESVFRAVEGRGSSQNLDWTKQNMGKIEESRNRIVSRAVVKLRTALGDTGFLALDAHVQSGTLARHISEVLPPGQVKF